MKKTTLIITVLAFLISLSTKAAYDDLHKIKKCSGLNSANIRSSLFIRARDFLGYTILAKVSVASVEGEDTCGRLENSTMTDDLEIYSNENCHVYFDRKNHTVKITVLRTLITETYTDAKCYGSIGRNNN